MGSGSGGRAEGGFNFGTMEERMFLQNKVQFTAVVSNNAAPTKVQAANSPTGGIMNQKALFANIEINIWIPRDPYLIN